MSPCGLVSTAYFAAFGSLTASLCPRLSNAKLHVLLLLSLSWTTASVSPRYVNVTVVVPSDRDANRPSAS